MNLPYDLGAPDCDVSVVLRVCDDEERIGHVIRRIGSHLSSLQLRFEILVVDEGSGDNTLAVAALLRPSLELDLMHAPPGHGFFRGCQRARGRHILLYDARSDAPLAALGYALARLRSGMDVVAVGGRYLVLRRTRAWRGFEALIQPRDHALVERRFLKRVRALGLSVAVTHPRRPTAWARLRDTLSAPRLMLRTFT
jgi:glycosyltransferase involved in cell wall biosynthesis